MPQKALITGITGQTGSFLAQQLLEAGYEVHGTTRSADKPAWRLSYFGTEDRIILHPVAPNNYPAIKDLVSQNFDKIFHLAAESSVASSLQHPSRTVEANVLQTTHWLEALRDVSPKTRFFNAASSEVFAPSDGLLTENSPKLAKNPYAVTKLAALNMAKVFRESFGLFIVNGILFNHESQLRDNRFVTAKIINSARDLATNKSHPPVELGNIAAERDFSHAGDFARGISASLNHEAAEDYIFASGQLHSIQAFFDAAGRYFGFSPKWTGQGLEATCTDGISGRKLALINEKFFRPIDEAGKRGDSQKAKTLLGWTPKYDFDSIIVQMAEHNAQSQD